MQKMVDNHLERRQLMRNKVAKIIAIVIVFIFGFIFTIVLGESQPRYKFSFTFLIVILSLLGINDFYNFNIIGKTKKFLGDN